MNAKDLMNALDGLDEKYVINAAPTENPQKSRPVWLKWGVAAACLCLTATVGLYALLHQPSGGSGIPSEGDSSAGSTEGGGAQSPDRVYGAWFNGFFYRPVSDIHHSLYPELGELYEQIPSGYIYRINEDCLGERLGTFPPTEEEPVEGVAYRWVEYPDYDSIIIVDRNGEYSFYVTDGDSILNGGRFNADELLGKLQIAGAAVYYSLDGGEETEELEPIYTLCEILRGKEYYPEPSDISRQKWERWYELRGDVGVRFENGSPVFDNNDIRSEYAEFYGSTIHSLFIMLDNGIEVKVTCDPEYNYLFICGNYYVLSEGEAERLCEALGI